MTANLKAVQWFRIEDLVMLFAKSNRRIPAGTIADELRRGWFKWSNQLNGVPGFECGVPLDALPEEHQLPSLDQQVTKEFVFRFAQEQGWGIPQDLAGASPSNRRPGRPSKRMPEIISEYEKRVRFGRLEGTLKEDAVALRAWAMSKFPRDDIAALNTICNKISPIRRQA